MPEGGHLTCGDLIVGTDTHSVTYGAFNAFGTGVEGTDLSAVMMTGKLWFRVPETIRIEIKGQLQPGVWAKDITLTMLGRLGAEGANYKALEYTGSAVAAMEIDDRMTLSNHAAELGAKAAILEADEKTFAWLKAHKARAPQSVKADANAVYARRIEIDASTLAPQIARNHQIDDVIGVPEVKGQKINSRDGLHHKAPPDDTSGGGDPERPAHRQGSGYGKAASREGISNAAREGRSKR